MSTSKPRRPTLVASRCATSAKAPSSCLGVPSRSARYCDASRKAPQGYILYEVQRRAVAVGPDGQDDRAPMLEDPLDLCKVALKCSIPCPDVRLLAHLDQLDAMIGALNEQIEQLMHFCARRAS